MATSDRDTRRSPELQALLVRAADGELDGAEQADLERRLAADPGLAAELEELRAAGRALVGFGLRQPNPDDWEHFETALFPRVERLGGWLLLLVGCAALIGYGLVLWLTDPAVPLAIKLGGGALIGGLAVLTAHVGRRAWREYRKDPYRDVIR
jgi:ferric-dicitrate binding protein FerR (iron transport regulator)